MLEKNKKENIISKEYINTFLKTQKVNLNDVATVDHFYPKSKFEYLKKEEKNFVISCYECNNKKRDKLWEIEKIKYPLNNNKITELKKIV